MSLLAAMDRFVHRTRLDILTGYAPKRSRNLRWLPGLAIIGLPLGFALGRAGSTRPDPTLLMISLALIVTSGVGGALIRLWGPRIGDDAGAIDERERLLRYRASGIAGHLLAAFVTLGCFYAIAAGALGWWAPREPLDWMYLGFSLQFGWQLLPVWIASWLQPAIPHEE